MGIIAGDVFLLMRSSLGQLLCDNSGLKPNLELVLCEIYGSGGELGAGATGIRPTVFTRALEWQR